MLLTVFTSDMLLKLTHAIIFKGKMGSGGQSLPDVILILSMLLIEPTHTIF